MAERTVRVAMMAYRDADGTHRYATAGAVVQVSSESLDRFDRLNRLIGDPEPETPKVEAKKPQTPRRKASE